MARATSIANNASSLAGQGLGQIAPSPARTKVLTLWLPALVGLILLAVELYSLLYDLGGRPLSAVGNRELVGTYLGGTKDVWNKPAGTLTWHVPEIGDLLYREDAIATMADSEALVEFTDGSQIRVEPNSLVVLEEAPDTSHPTRTIAIRLVRGTLVRRKGTATPMQVSFQGPEGMGTRVESVKIEDVSGDSVVRIGASRDEGLKLSVESGSIKLNGAQVVEKDQGIAIQSSKSPLKPVPKEALQLKLRAPKVNRPKVKLESSSLPRLRRTHSASAVLPLIRFAIGELLMPAAKAEPTAKATVDLSWEYVLGARGYRLQVAESPEFNKPIFDRELSSPYYRYLIESGDGQKLYYRVAAVDEDGVLGEFSPAEQIELPPPVEVPAPQAAVANVAETKAETKTETRAETKVNRAPVVQAKARIPVVPREFSPGWRFETSLGILFHSRKISSDANPQEVSAGGLVPAAFEAAGRYRRKSGTLYGGGISVLGESIKPQTTNVDEQPVAASVFALRGFLGKDFGGEELRYGAYLSNSQSFEFEGLKAAASREFLVGAFGEFRAEPGKARRVGWKAELAAYTGLGGGFGADLSVAGRVPLLKFFDRKDSTGVFVQPEAFGRFGSLETAFGGGVRVGYAL